MSSRDPVAALEIGTSHTMLAIGEAEGAAGVRIVALGSIPSVGVRKSRIVNIAQAAHSIESVLKRVERDFGYSIAHACLAVSGPHIRVKSLVTQRQIMGQTVGEDDLREIYNSALEAGPNPEERVLLDEAEIGYTLDGVATPSPSGLAGDLLTRQSLCVHGDARRVADARAAARRAKLEITDAYFAGSCAAHAVLGAAERQAGVLAIDLGGGSTTYSLHEGGRLVHAGVVGVGGDHVTHDVRTAFALSHAQAEELKKKASVCVGRSEAPARLAVAATTPGFDPVTVSRRALETVLNARMQELFAVILDDLDGQNLAHRFNAGVVLTGGGASLLGLTALAEHVFGRRARLGTFVPDIVPLPGGPAPAACATVAGLLLTACRNQEHDSGGNPFTNLLGGLFK